MSATPPSVNLTVPTWPGCGVASVCSVRCCCHRSRSGGGGPVDGQPVSAPLSPHGAAANRFEVALIYHVALHRVGWSCGCIHRIPQAAGSPSKPSGRRHAGRSGPASSTSHVTPADGRSALRQTSVAAPVGFWSVARPQSLPVWPSRTVCPTSGPRRHRSRATLPNTLPTGNRAGSLADHSVQILSPSSTWP